MDYARLPPRAVPAIHFANVRFGILPPQSRFRGNDVSLEVVSGEEWAGHARSVRFVTAAQEKGPVSRAFGGLPC